MSGVLSIGAFRTDIEGLRGLSVLAVVLYHAFPLLVPGGFIGVDIFFVISGYLISGLLFREFFHTGRINLAEFWARRIRRILPAATLILLCIAAISLLLHIGDPRRLGSHILAAGLFYYNIVESNETVDYLASDDTNNPLLHFWTLAVEEQFYIFWPLLLVAFFFTLRYQKAKRVSALARVVILVAVLWCVSFLYSVYLSQTNPAAAFFDTPSRAWQLLTGAFVAGVELLRNEQGRNKALSFLCLLILLACFFVISGDNTYPGWIAAVPTFSAALLIYLGGSQTPGASQVLSLSLARYAGRISYSWYLWHWPLLVFGRVLAEPTPLAQCLILAISIALAAITYRFVEQPFRRSRFLSQSVSSTYLLGVGLIRSATAFVKQPVRPGPQLAGPTYLLGIGLLGSSAAVGLWMEHSAPDTVYIGSGIYLGVAKIENDRPSMYEDGCLVKMNDVKYAKCEYGNPLGARSVVLFGDSSAGNWLSPLEAAAKSLNWRLLVRIKASCRPIDEPQTVLQRKKLRDYGECSVWLRSVLDELSIIKPDLIFVTATPNDLPITGEQRVLKSLAAAGPTIAIKSTPQWPEEPVECLRRTNDPDSCVWSLAERVSSSAYPRSGVAEIPANVRVLDLNHRVCPNEKCRAVLDKELVFFDHLHMTKSYSLKFIENFKDILAGSGK